MKLIVGLGNPGPKYARNRHNVGFMAVERIADHNNLGNWRSRFHSQACEGDLGGERVLLLKPQTFYNETGNAVREAAKFLKIKVHDVIVFHDEIDLAPGKLRVKTGGGLAGNNGLRSMQAQLSSADFTRVRIGVGHPGDKNQVANYVLRDFPKADAAWLELVLDTVARSAGQLANGENDRFQSDVAQALSEMRDRDQAPSAPGSSEQPALPTAMPGSSAARKSPARTSSRPAPGSSGPPASSKRSGGPSQLELARKSAGKKAKPSRKIKKGIQDDPAAPTTEGKPDKAVAGTDRNETSVNPLADRLKRWFTGGTDDKT